MKMQPERPDYQDSKFKKTSVEATYNIYYMLVP